MARGKVSQWNGQIGRIQDDVDGAACFFGDRALQGLQPGDVHVGLEVEFDREHNNRGATGRNVRRPGVSASPPPAAAAPTGRVEGSRGPRMGGPSPGGTRRLDAVPMMDDRAILADVPVPAGLRTVLGIGKEDRQRHPGLMLDRFLQPCPKQEQQRDVLNLVAGLAGDAPLLAEQNARRAASLRALNSATWSRTTQGPLTLHLARASALENAGLCLHPIYGFAYLPGTGLKGMTRAYAETVWYLGQPDPIGAWQQIEQVFGWAPGSDQIGRKRKPWKHESVPDHDDKHAANVGTIVFHDAWPEKWPGLVVDIVNNHHPTYYRGDDAPGDWDAPNPVYFLAVKPGTVFSFALGKRRADVDDEYLKLAGEWLDGALTVLGCGAKTAAGYGSFVLDPARPVAKSPWLVQASCTLDLVTPAFLAGAAQGQEDCDLRSATLRGLLRWWWRTMHAGFVDVTTLRNMEATVWGDTEAGGAVQLQLESIGEARKEPYDRRKWANMRPEQKVGPYGIPGGNPQKTTQGLWYASYGMSEKESPRHVCLPGAQWRVHLTARQRVGGMSMGLLLDQARAALWLLCRFGGVGSKGRKGFGSLRINEEEAGWALQRCREEGARLRAAVGLPDVFQDRFACSPSLEQLLGPVQETFAWPDSWGVLDQVGFALQEFAKKYAHQLEKRALGLPRRIGPGVDGQFNPTGPVGKLMEEALRKRKEENVRHASPVHVHLDGAPGRYTVRVTAMVASFLPTLQESKVFLQECLEDVSASLKRRAGLQPPRATVAPAAPVASTRPGSVKVRVLERRPDLNGKPCFRVQEEGARPGILIDGTPPTTLPEVDAEIVVYPANTDRNSPRYRWTLAEPPRPSPRPKGRR